MPHDWVKWPELRNSEMASLYFQSPHKQITEDFRATVVKVIDGDTIKVTVDFRDFEFPIRMVNTNAPEMGEDGGKESREWLRTRIEGRVVDVLINRKQRVGKYGRLLGIIMSMGINMNEASIVEGKATSFENRNEGKIPNFAEEMMKIG